MALYPFKFETTVNNNTSAASLEYLFTDNTTTIFDFYAGVNGNLNQSVIDTSSNPDGIINNANAYFQVFNIKLAATIDYKGLSNKVNEIYSNTTAADSVMNREEADAMNQYIAIVLMYADTKQKIAQAEFYPVMHTDTYTFGNQTYTSYYYSSDIRFIFSDGSKGDLATYFGSGFSAVVSDFNNLLIKLNTNFNLGAGPVTYP